MVYRKVLQTSKKNGGIPEQIRPMLQRGADENTGQGHELFARRPSSFIQAAGLGQVTPVRVGDEAGGGRDGQKPDRNTPKQDSTPSGESGPEVPTFLQAWVEIRKQVKPCRAQATAAPESAEPKSMGASPRNGKWF